MSRQISEERTRNEMIDPQLETAGWFLCEHSNRNGVSQHNCNTNQTIISTLKQSLELLISGIIVLRLSFDEGDVKWKH
jgi:hypothetical protein